MESQTSVTLKPSYVDLTGSGRSFVDEINSSIFKNVASFVQNRPSAYMTEAEISSQIETFQKIYLDTLHGHLLINGKPLPECSDSEFSSQESSCSSVSTEEDVQSYITQKLNPQVDESLVLTTRLRRETPYRCAQLLAHVAKMDCSYYRKVRVAGKTHDLQVPPNKTPDAVGLQQTISSSQQMIQGISGMTGEAAELRKAVSITDECSNSHADHLLFTPDNRKLTCKPPHSRKLEFPMVS